MNLVYIALGSNLGDRSAYMSRALSALINRGILISPIRFSPTYQSQALLKPGAKEAWKKDFLNMVVEGRTLLSAENLLAKFKKIELELGRKSSEDWAPREIDIDLLLYGNRRIESDSLKIPHPEIAFRDFWLMPLKDLLGDQEIPSLHQPAGFFLEQLSQMNRVKRIPLALMPSEFLSVINVTPDSFSDGGRFDSTEAALAQVEAQVQAGCSVVDLGAESTRPGARELTENEEWERLRNVVPAISWFRSRQAPWLKLSMDTRKARVAEQALEYGFDWVNDVSAGEDPKMLDVVCRSECRFVFMHHQGVPVQPGRHLAIDKDPVQCVQSWAQEKITGFEGRGLEANRLIMDPGLGFGKTAAQSAELLARVGEFSELGVDILVGHSRKSFLNLVTEEAFSDRDPETAVLAAELQRVESLRYIRVHQVAASLRASRAHLLSSRCSPLQAASFY